jgi:hypothetical protein
LLLATGDAKPGEDDPISGVARLVAVEVVEVSEYEYGLVDLFVAQPEVVPGEPDDRERAHAECEPVSHVPANVAVGPTSLWPKMQGFWNATAPRRFFSARSG